MEPIAPPTFGPHATFFLTENGGVAAIEDGKYFALGPKGKCVVDDVPVLTA